MTSNCEVCGKVHETGNRLCDECKEDSKNVKEGNIEKYLEKLDRSELSKLYHDVSKQIASIEDGELRRLNDKLEKINLELGYRYNKELE